MSNRQASLIAPRIPDSQHYLIVTNAGNQKGLLGKALVTLGSLGPGTYECEISVEGMAECSVHLRCSAVTGTVTPVFETRWLDGTQRATAPGATAFAVNTAQTLTLTNLKGQKKAYVVITIGGSAALTFNRAEFNGQ
jgi:hypothetical protein